MKKFTQVEIVYNEFEGGFWGMIDEKNQALLPIHFPEQLKIIKAKVKIGYIEVDTIGFNMWGTYIKIISFETIAIKPYGYN